MSWSNKWDVPSDVAKIERASEAQKVHDDAAMYGIGYYDQDGKHIPREDIIENWKPDDKLPEAPGLERLKTKTPWMAPVSVGVDYGSGDKSFETAIQDGKIVSQYEIRPIKLGNKTISVTVVGDLGLDFCEPGEKDAGWNIYHLPTLACFSSAVPCKFEYKAIDGYDYDKPELLNWMAKVQENYPTSWQVLRLLTPDTYQDNGKTAKEIIQKWCLSVKVE